MTIHKSSCFVLYCLLPKQHLRGHEIKNMKALEKFNHQIKGQEKNPDIQKYLFPLQDEIIQKHHFNLLY